MTISRHSAETRENVTDFRSVRRRYEGGNADEYAGSRRPVPEGIIESGVYEAKVYQKEDGDGTAIVKALLKELNLDESEVEKLETIPYYELSNAYNKVEAEVAAKGCYIGQGPMENGWFRGNPIKCGFTDHAKTIPVLAGTNIGEFDFGPVVPGKHEMNREEQIAFLRENMVMQRRS